MPNRCWLLRADRPVRSALALIPAMFAILLVTDPVLAVDRFVPAGFPTIQEAIDASVSGDRILVSGGSYVGPVDYQGKSLEVIGVDGASLTLLSLANLGSAVSIIEATDPFPLRLQGFTISGGTGQFTSGVTPALGGGGVFVQECSPVIEDCVFTDNEATVGGAIYLELSDAQILNCDFVENLSSEGGAIFAVDSEPVIQGSSFELNSVFGRGGAAHFTRSPAEIIDCTFQMNAAGRGGALSFADNSDGEVIGCTIDQNDAFEQGGGITLDQFSDVEIFSTTVTNNTAASAGGIGITHFAQAVVVDVEVTGNVAGEGGGIRIFESCPILERVTVRGNTADGTQGGSGEGGGIYMQLRADTILRNCIIAENNAALAGGGVFLRWDCEPLFVHTVIADNQAAEGGAIGLDHYSVPEIWNSILWGNQAPVEPVILVDPESSFSLFFSDVEGGADGIEIIDADPLFTPDYRIDLCSPVIDRGSPGAPMLPAFDIDGNPRFQGFAPDQGVAETPTGSGNCFVRGDVNDDAAIDLSDAMSALGWLFAGGTLPCRDAADVDDSGVIDLADPVRLLTYLFEAAAPPPPPEMAEPAPDPTSDLLDCRRGLRTQ